jgi:hypothetical protein
MMVIGSASYLAAAVGLVAAAFASLERSQP